MKKKICQYLSKVLEEMPEKELFNLVEIPLEEKMGDLAVPCFAMAKKIRKNPMQIVAELVERLNEQKDELGIEKVESVGAYCNIHLKRDLFVQKCFESLQKDKYGVSQIGAGKTVCMDYSSPNIAKNFHVGHLRTTIIGNSLYKIYQKLGYEKGLCPNAEEIYKGIMSIPLYPRMTNRDIDDVIHAVSKVVEYYRK